MVRGRVLVFPGMFPAIIRVAPNSPMARAKDRTVPAMIPRRARGRMTRQSCLPFGMTQRIGGKDQFPIHRFHGRPAGLDHEGQGHNKGGQGGSVPGKHEAPPGPGIKDLSQPAVSAEKNDQIISGYRRGQNQRKGEKDIYQFLSPKIFPGQEVGDGYPDDHDKKGRRQGDLQGKPKGKPDFFASSIICYFPGVLNPYR